MATKAQDNSGQIREFHKSKWTWIVIVVSFLSLLVCRAIKKNDVGIQPPVVTQPAPSSMPIQHSELEMREVPIQSGCWSEWITLTDGRWYWNAPGWIQFQLEDGGMWTVQDGVAFDLGSIPGHRFRARGAPGMLKLFIQRR